MNIRGCSPLRVLLWEGVFGVIFWVGAFSWKHLWRAASAYGIFVIYIYVFPSTRLTHLMCVLKHEHFIYFSIFSELDDKTLSLLQVLFSTSIAVEIYMIMYVCTRAYAQTIYIYICVYCMLCVSLCECVCVYIYFKFLYDFWEWINKCNVM